MSNYYEDKLNSNGLVQVYDTKIQRVRQYLDAEIQFVKDYLKGSEKVLELGAGYGRIVKEISSFCSYITGIDISKDSVFLSEEYLKDIDNGVVRQLDVHSIEATDQYDIVLCLQNGLSAMRIDTDEQIERILELVKPGGRMYFSTYSNKFWNYRIDWFVEQSEKGLLGELDFNKTKDGVIVCKDGFRATTHTIEDLNLIGERSGYPYEIKEVDESSLFLIISKS